MLCLLTTRFHEGESHLSPIPTTYPSPDSRPTSCLLSLPASLRPRRILPNPIPLFIIPGRLKVIDAPDPSLGESSVIMLVRKVTQAMSRLNVLGLCLDLFQAFETPWSVFRASRFIDLCHAGPQHLQRQGSIRQDASADIRYRHLMEQVQRATAKDPGGSDSRSVHTGLCARSDTTSSSSSASAVPPAASLAIPVSVVVRDDQSVLP